MLNIWKRTSFLVFCSMGISCTKNKELEQQIPKEVCLEIIKENKYFMAQVLSTAPLVGFNVINGVFYVFNGIAFYLYARASILDFVKEKEKENIEYLEILAEKNKTNIITKWVFILIMPIVFGLHILFNTILVYMVEYYKAKVMWLIANSILAVALMICMTNLKSALGMKYYIHIGATLINTIANSLIIGMSSTQKILKTNVRKLCEEIASLDNAQLPALL